VARAGLLGRPLTIAIIGGRPDRFVPLVDLYRRAAAEGGHSTPPLAINTHAFVGADTADADRAFAHSYTAMMTRIGRERGWPPMGRDQYVALRSPHGALAVGSAQEVAEKDPLRARAVRPPALLAHMSVGAVEHADVLRSIERFGTEVAPVLRAELDRRAAA
jgi:hypothetical protein